MNTLPFEVIYLIFSQLSYVDKINLSSVNHNLHSLRPYIRLLKWKSYREKDIPYFYKYPSMFSKIFWSPQKCFTMDIPINRLHALIVDSSSSIEHYIQPTIKHLMLSKSPIIRAHHVQILTYIQSGYVYIPKLTVDSIQKINMPNVHIGELCISDRTSIYKLCLTKVDNIIQILDESSNLHTLKLVIYPQTDKIYNQIQKVYVPTHMTYLTLITNFPQINHLDYTYLSDDIQNFNERIQGLTIRCNTGTTIPKLNKISIKINMAESIDFHGSKIVKYYSNGESVYLLNAENLYIIYSLGSIKMSNITYHEYRIPKSKI